jgi:hypothetical protein
MVVPACLDAMIPVTFTVKPNAVWLFPWLNLSRLNGFFGGGKFCSRYIGFSKSAGVRIFVDIGVGNILKIAAWLAR